MSARTMSDSTPIIILSIDIGSTRTHIAAVNVDTLQCADRIDSDNGGFDGSFAANIKRIADAHPQIRKVNITSCVRSLAAKAEEICINLCINPGEKRFDAVELIRPRDGLLVAFNYEDPDALGTDRICDALACAALFKGRTCVIVDAGTAITVDYLRDGRVFEGGAILPGCAAQFAALHAKTDALPLIDVYGLNGINGINGTNNGGRAATLPAKSTAECIKAGVLYGTAGAVERCINEYLRVNSGGGVLIAATGGGWELIKPLINRETVTIPDLTLIGAAVYR